MYKEPKTMKEIHDIQVKLYEEQKHLSHKELTAKIHREVQEGIKKYGLKFKKKVRAA